MLFAEMTNPSFAFRVFGTGKEALPFLAACAVVLLSFFTYHVHYLAFVRFDYGYNMKANVTVGRY